MKLKSLLLILFLVLSCTNNKRNSYTSENFKLQKISEGVYACIHKIGGKAICNVGIIDNGEATIIFDTFLSPIVAKELLTIVDTLNLSPIKYVINSHFHNDHIRGNQVFNNDVKIISTKTTRNLIEENEPGQLAYEKEFANERFAYYDSLYNSYIGDTTDIEYTKILMWRPYYEILSKSSVEVKTRLPDTFWEEEMNLSGPNVDVQLISRGQGHTEDDLILHLPNENIIFSGDLVFNDCHPYIGDGYPTKWKEYLEYIISLNPIIVVPGHGELAKVKDVQEMKDYIITLENIATNFAKDNPNSEDLNKIQIPDQYKHWLFERFFNYNLSFMVSEIKNSSQ